MSHNPAIRAYCRQVGRALELPKTHKRHLLDGLERELEERFSDKTGLTLETLCRDTGPPEKSATELMEGVDEKDRAQYRFRQKLLTRLLIVSLAVLVATAIIYCSYIVQHSVDYAEVRISQYDIE